MIPTERSHLNVAAVSHPGLSGKNNEDRYGVSAYRMKAGAKPTVLAIVADGIGGHRAGEVAAEMAVETVSQAVADSDGSQPVQTLQQAIIQASQAIHRQAELDNALKGMGTTCACVWIIGDRLYMASVGDTRVYLLRAGQIHQLTTDHTWIQEAIENGALTQEEARGHPNAHVIRRYLGSKNEVVPDTRLRLHPGEADKTAESNQGMLLETDDLVLVCSDGLTDLVSDAEILGVFTSAAIEPALEQLVNLANQRGGHDNITLVALQVPQAQPQVVAAPVPVPGRKVRIGATCLVSGLLLAAVLLVGGGLFWVFTRGSSSPTPQITSNPQIQTTLFPAGTPAKTPSTSPEDIASPSAPPRSTPTVLRPFPGTQAAPSIATLTPWPTNTLAP
jgi:protein phosphatase